MRVLAKAANRYLPVARGLRGCIMHSSQADLLQFLQFALPGMASTLNPILAAGCDLPGSLSVRTETDQV
jgi:hypothetical protein